MNNVDVLTPWSVVTDREQSNTEPTVPVLTWSMQLFREERQNSNRTPPALRVYPWLMLQYTQLIEAVNCLLEIKSETNLILMSLCVFLLYSTVQPHLMFHDKTLNPHSHGINRSKSCNRRDKTAFRWHLNRMLSNKERELFIPIGQGLIFIAAVHSYDKQRSPH